MTGTSHSICERICQMLEDQNVDFQMIYHQPTYTSADSAAARGELLSIGGKSLVIKTDDCFRICVMPADRRLDSKRARILFATRKVRFATREELTELTGLVPGAVPPFGRPIFPLDLYLDSALTRNKKIAFNAGSLTISIAMETADYVRVAAPILGDFSKLSLS